MLQSWRRDPLFHVHQALDPVLRPAARAAAVRRRARRRASSPPSSNVPLTVERALAVARRAGRAADRRRRSSCSTASATGSASRRRRSSISCPRPTVSRSTGAVGPARQPPSIGCAPRLAGLDGLSDVVGVGEEAFVWFLRNVAADRRVPRRAGAARPTGVGARRRVGGRRQASGRPPCRCHRCRRRRPRRSPARPRPRTEVRRFYDDGGLPQPARQRCAATSTPNCPPTSPRCASSASSTTSPTSSASTTTACPTCRRRRRTCPTSTPPTLATRGPGSSHEGAHYQQLSLSNAHPNPVRRRYYDSGAERGDRLLQRGVPAAGRAVRRRAAHAGGDLELRPAARVARRGRRAPGDRGDEPRRRRRLLRPPGADGPPDRVRGVVLLRRQSRPGPVVPDRQAAADEPRRRGRRGATATRSRCAASTTRSGATATSRSRCCAGNCSAIARCSTPSTPIRRPVRRRRCRRGSADARRCQAAQLRRAARLAGPSCPADRRPGDTTDG